MPERWRESVEEHRETMETIAAGDGPLSEDCAALIDEADADQEG